ncbi:unknown [Ruminococcus sp. CAG:353]|nr:unknown [Ruminococcus sp. CAG:353]
MYLGITLCIVNMIKCRCKAVLIIICVAVLVAYVINIIIRIRCKGYFISDFGTSVSLQLNISLYQRFEL